MYFVDVINMIFFVTGIKCVQSLVRCEEYDICRWINAQYNVSNFEISFCMPPTIPTCKKKTFNYLSSDLL